MELKTLGILCALFVITQSIPHKLYPRTEKIREKSRVKPLADGDTYRLPKDTHPISYDLKIKTNLESSNPILKSDFSGTVSIHIHVDKDTKDIIMHKKWINVNVIRVECDGTGVLTTDTGNTNRDQDFFIITRTGGNFTAGSTCTIDASFFSTLRTDNLGFYLSSYNNSGTMSYIATTQFESVEARTTFPCYDEPGIRATFKIEITHGKDFIAISNMNGTTVITGNTAVTTFEETPPVQTYLIAFTVSNFKSVATNDYAKIPQRVFAKPQSVNAGEADIALRYAEVGSF